MKRLELIVVFFTIFLAGHARAEFSDNRYECLDETGYPVFTFGSFTSRGGWGQVISTYDRTDFNVNFAEELKDNDAFGERRTGPTYIDYRNTYYSDNQHRTFLGGGQTGATYLYVLKPGNGREVTLEVWKWGNFPHYGHVVLSGDKLVYQKSFQCD